MPLVGLSAGSRLKTVNELVPAAASVAARAAELLLARRKQALSSAHARLVSGA
jgi:hypothetical protein